MRIAICDDENRILEDLSRMVLELIPDADVSAFGEGRALIDSADKAGYDVVLLDIDMPDLNGLEVALSFQAADRKPLIIFVTSHDELVYDSLQLHPFGFVRKSYLDKELKKVLEDAVEEVSSRDKHFFFHTASGDIKLQLDDILYFESEGNYIKIKTGSDEFRFRETMQALEMSLKSGSCQDY